MADSGDTTSLFKSRVNLLNLLNEQGYDVNDYTEFSPNEVHIMNANKQLDMLLTKDNKSKAYIKYHLAKTLRRENINNYVDDLFNLEEVLNKQNDCLIIVIRQELNDPLMNILNDIWNQEGIFITVFNIDRLQFNILEHDYVPKHTILNEDEVNQIKKEYNIVDTNDLPQISRYDPVALAIGMRPDDICKIVRPSKTSITTNYYRKCSQ